MIFAKLVLLSTCLISADEPPSLSGHVFYNGNTVYKTVRDNDGNLRPVFQTNPKNKGAIAILVYLKNPPASSKKVQSTKPLTVDQFVETFEPHITIASPGQEIRFTNSDALNHNVRADGSHSRNEFNVVSTPARTYTRSFQLEAMGNPIPIACDIHRWMSAWVYIFEHPFATLTDDSGHFTLPPIPAGTYTLVIEQPDLEYRKDLLITLPLSSPINIELETSAQKK
jgi:plastocyanin